MQSVNVGNNLVGDAGLRMQQIVGQVSKVRDLISEIVGTSQQQANRIDQVGTAVSQIDKTTQQNAALVAQSSAAAFSLKDQAAQLGVAIAAFRIGQPNFAAQT
ncbi:MAG: hypothetical protein H7232_03505 [Aeromicrobium sp.]|nr:hypothetical protein [Burkholderiales bacterium]